MVAKAPKKQIRCRIKFVANSEKNGGGNECLTWGNFWDRMCCIFPSLLRLQC